MPKENDYTQQLATNSRVNAQCDHCLAQVQHQADGDCEWVNRGQQLAARTERWDWSGFSPYATLLPFPAVGLHRLPPEGTA